MTTKNDNSDRNVLVPVGDALDGCGPVTRPPASRGLAGLCREIVLRCRAGHADREPRTLVDRRMLANALSSDALFAKHRRSYVQRQLRRLVATCASRHRCSRSRLRRLPSNGVSAVTHMTPARYERYRSGHMK